MNKDKRTKEEFLKEIAKVYLENTPVTRMTEDQSMMLVSLYLMNGEAGYEESFIGEAKESDLNSVLIQDSYNKTPLAKIVADRLLIAGGKRITLPAVMFVSGNCTKPGGAVMLAHYIWMYSNSDEVKLEEVAGNLFSNGYWSEDQERLIWKAQKRYKFRPDNWFDWREAWLKH